MATSQPEWTSKLLDAPHEVSDKSGRVRRMFNAIAPRYELVNTLCSVGRDAYWRKQAVRLVGARAGDRVLDVACGTGDFSRTFLSAGVAGVVGCDFAHDMLALADAPRRGNRSGARVAWCEADAQRLPFRSSRFSIVSCAFGVRNFADLDAGLGEMYRVIAPGGRVVILEFTRPRNRIARQMYEVYSNHLMPMAASVISRDRSGAYRYLPRSVVSFLDGSQMAERLEDVGFVDVCATHLTLGVVTVYVGRRA